MHPHTVCVAIGLALSAAACDSPEQPPPPQSEAPPAPVTTPVDPSVAPAAQPPLPVAGAERDFVAEAAASGIAEVEASQLVAARTGDARIKAYAEQVERERRSINEELQRIAGAKGIDLPANAEGEPRERLNRLAALGGEELGRTYLQEFGIEAHRSAIDRFERQAQEGQDPELRAFAERFLPTLREHLAMAQQIQDGGAATGGGGGGSGSGGAPDGKSGGGSS